MTRSFPGEVMHSRFYRRPEDYAGQTVLVVGSFASGTDLSRQLASLNLHKYDPSGRPFTPDGDDLGFGFTKVYVSSSGEPNITSSSGPWNRYTTHVPLIHHVEGPTIFLEDHPPLEGVDVMIFATGYNFSLPFCKRTDAPWCEKAVLDVEIEAGERGGGEERDVGGIKGLAMRELDGLMLFLEGDRSIAFPVLRESASFTTFTKSKQMLMTRRIRHRPLPIRRDASPPNIPTMGGPPPPFPPPSHTPAKSIKPLLRTPSNTSASSLGDTP